MSIPIGDLNKQLNSLRKKIVNLFSFNIWFFEPSRRVRKFSEMSEDECEPFIVDYHFKYPDSDYSDSNDRESFHVS